MNTPNITVGTFGKYAKGNLDNIVLDVEDFHNLNEFLEEAEEYHKQDEQDPELQYVTSEGIPSFLVSEYNINPKLFIMYRFWEEETAQDVSFKKWAQAVHDDNDILYLEDEEVYRFLEDNRPFVKWLPESVIIQQYLIDEAGITAEQSRHIFGLISIDQIKYALESAGATFIDWDNKENRHGTTETFHLISGFHTELY